MATVSHQARIQPTLAVAGYFDIMGQKDLLEKLSKSDLSPNSATLEEDLKSLVTPLLQARWYFTDVLSQQGLPQYILEKLENSERSKAGSIGKRKHIDYFFSDSFFIIQPLDSDHSDSDALTIFSFILAAGMAELACLAEGVPVRGGIQLGFGFHYQDENDEQSNFYGPVMAQAFRLESELAEFPRVVVGTDLLKVINQRLTSAKTTDSFEALVFEECNNLIVAGTDGFPTINLAGPAISHACVHNGHDVREMCERGKHHAQSAIAELMKAGKQREFTKQYRLLKQMDAFLATLDQRTPQA